MSDQPTISIDALIPGGIRDTDHLHLVLYDETCSRCRKPIAEDEVPLLVWRDDGVNMYAFCCRCMGWGSADEAF